MNDGSLPMMWGYDNPETRILWRWTMVTEMMCVLDGHYSDGVILMMITRHLTHQYKGRSKLRLPFYCAKLCIKLMTSVSVPNIFAGVCFTSAYTRSTCGLFNVASRWYMNV